MLSKFLALKGLRGGGATGGGGGAEVKTCNVRFKSFSAEAGEYGIFAIEHPYFYGDACYSTYENGEIVSKEIEIEHWDDEFDITLENVVCGSLIYFNQDGGIIEIDEAYDGKNHTKFETLFIAPTVPNVTAVFKCGLEGEIEW